MLQYNTEVSCYFGKNSSACVGPNGVRPTAARAPLALTRPWPAEGTPIVMAGGPWETVGQMMTPAQAGFRARLTIVW